MHKYSTPPEHKRKLDDDDSQLKAGDEVELHITDETDLGFKAIINNTDEGLLYHNEIFEPVHPGDIKRGYIKQIREDGKIDLSLQQQGYGYIQEIKHSILQQVKANNGFLKLGDKSSPEEIYRILKISKKAFKKAIGALYKERFLVVRDNEIRLFDRQGE